MRYRKKFAALDIVDDDWPSLVAHATVKRRRQLDEHHGAVAQVQDSAAWHGERLARSRCLDRPGRCKRLIRKLR